MDEIDLSQLDDRLRQLASNAKRALAQGDTGYVVEVLREVFAVQPGCAELRRTWWQALQQERGSGGFGALLNKLRGNRTAGTPLERLRAASARIEQCPRDPAALRAMVEAAHALGWPATECFALEAWAEVEPRSKTAALQLIDSLQRGDNFDAAQAVLERLQHTYPHDGDVQEAGRALALARTMREGGWERGDSFRDKLR